MWVSREPGTDLIRLQVTSGPVTVIVDEHAPAMSQLHRELGELLAESPAPADGPGQAPGQAVP